MKVTHTHSLVLLSRKVLIAVARCQVRRPGSLVVIVELVHQPRDLIKCPIDLGTLAMPKQTTKMRGMMVQLYTSALMSFPRVIQAIYIQVSRHVAPRSIFTGRLKTLCVCVYSCPLLAGSVLRWVVSV